MVKKIFDISPPKRLEKKEVKRFYPEKKSEFKLPPSGSRLGKKIIFIPLVLIIAGIAAYFSLSRVDIEIWPETEVETFEIKLTVDKKIENLDFSSNLIPGTIFKESKSFSQEFPSSGKKLIEKKAEGVIRVFNDYHLAQVLVSQTRFQPPLEKFKPSLGQGENPWFRTIERVVVPAKSHVDVKVVADTPGEKYNIESSDFSIPGLAGTPQYTVIYGKSFEVMKGGFKKEVPEVTQEDLKEAEKILIEKAAKEMRDILRNKIPAGFVILEENLKTEILETFSLAQAGSELEKFTFQAKAETQTVSFKKEDLENFSKEFVVSKIPAGKEFDQKSLGVEYFPETVNLEEGKTVLSLNLKTKIYSAIDEISLKRGLAGKSLAETQLFLQSQPEIIRTQVKLWPFWVKRVPENLEKIEISIIVDPAL